MTQHYAIANLGCDSNFSDSDSGSYWSDDDEDRFCRDAEWEVSRAAKAWEARRVIYAKALIKQGDEEAALTHIRFLFEEEEDEDEECATCKPNSDWDWLDGDNEYSSDSDTDSDR